jgi:hypothetical protein
MATVRALLTLARINTNLKFDSNCNNSRFFFQAALCAFGTETVDAEAKRIAKIESIDR